jgi:mediator of RNA polymerase II transcription subunit 31
MFEKPEFVAYLDYLQYFKQPQWVKYLSYVLSVEMVFIINRQPRYPGPTLRALELLQQEQFRKNILNPAVMEQLFKQGIEASEDKGR